jgi:hypothetical protein
MTAAHTSVPLRAIVINEPSEAALRRAYRFLREMHVRIMARRKEHRAETNAA